MSGWIGVDLDGTLAHYEGWKNGEIGAPVPAMLERVKHWVAQGREVRIFTARVSDGPYRHEVIKAIQQWCRQHGLPELQVTNVKDFGMIELWDDRCVQVVPNTGMPVGQPTYAKINDHRAAGESADVAQETSGMECGHAAPQGAAPSKQPEQSETANPRPDLEGSAADQPRPAGAAVSERCTVNDTGEQCPNPAAGGLRVNFYATPTIQKRYGKRVMLSLIFDLPICLACISKVAPDNLMTGEQWRAFSKVAQQRNSGVLADRSQTEIVLCQFDDPEYVALREQIAKKRAANDSQPATAGATTRS